MYRFWLISFFVFVTSNSFAEVDISGYLDMEYVTRFGERPHKDPEFDQHHISLIFQHEADIFKILTELEWEHSASFEASDGGTATGDGKIVVERAWGDINLSKYFNIRLGLFLNSTIYHQNHFPSIIVNISRPQIVNKIFDPSFEGIKLYGEVYQGINYDFWITRDPKQRNGGSEATEHEGTSLGSRLGYHRKISKDLYLDMGILWANFNTSSSSDTTAHLQTALGAQAEVVYKNFTLWTELGERVDKDILSNTQRGLYSLLSYSHFIGSKEIIPFLMYDQYIKNSSSLEPIKRTGLGITYRPISTVTFKSEYLKTSSYQTSTSSVKSAQQIGLAFIYFFN
jgi:hypothetical protein